MARPANDEYKVAVTQDTLGNYKIKYSIGDITKTENRNQDGSVTGSYSYLDANGILQTIQYTAGQGGFVVTDGTNLPVAPQLQDIQLPQAPLIPVVPEVHQLEQIRLEPVEYTPEVAAARAEHLALVEEAKRRLVV